jgi:hypothetical protein
MMPMMLKRKAKPSATAIYIDDSTSMFMSEVIASCMVWALSTG